MRQFVYDYHIENTYDVEDWDIIFREYAFVIDVNEQRKLINSLTFSRQPWQLTEWDFIWEIFYSVNFYLNFKNSSFFYSVLQGIGENFVLRMDFFKIASVLVNNPIGREIVWDYFRENYEKIVAEYGEDDPRLGWILIEIVDSFENEYLYQEMLDFLFKATTGATANARFKVYI